MIKKLTSFEIFLLSLLPSFSDEGTALSERVRKPWEQLIDVHQNSGFNRQKKTFRGRVFRGRVSDNRCNSNRETNHWSK